MADEIDWNRSDYVHPTLHLSQERWRQQPTNKKTKRAKSKSKNEFLNLPANIRLENHRFLLIKSSDHKHFSYSVKCGTHTRWHRKSPFTYLSSTDFEHCLYMKLTAAGLSNGPERLICEIINFCERKNLWYKRLPAKHCTICFEADHDNISCENCSYCCKPGHKRAECTVLYPSAQRIVASIFRKTSNSDKQERKKWKRIAERQSVTKSLRVDKVATYWKKVNTVQNCVLLALEPIGPPWNLKETLALDTEGSGKVSNPVFRGAGSVVISAWCGNIIGYKTVCFFLIKRRSIIDPDTWVTGLQMNHYVQALPEDEVKETVLNIVKNKRLVVHGQPRNDGASDLLELGITASEIRQNNIEVVNTSQIFGKISLHKLSKFLSPQCPHDRLSRDNSNVVQGHSPEKDARITLDCYRKSLQIFKDYGCVPQGDYIRDALDEGKSIDDWKAEIVPWK